MSHCWFAALGLQPLYSCRALDPVELVRVVGAELRRDRPQPRPDDVVSGDGRAVGPLDVVAEVERDVGAADIPALRERRLRCEVRRLAEPHDRRVDVADDERGRRVGREARVE